MGKRKNNEKYHRIINAATKVFAKKGFYQSKISEIAKEAKVADGTIYIGEQTNGVLHAIATDCGGPADSAWPMFLHDAQHTGQVP